ncbi:17444_t:CDS:2 [Funneliformis geosporum]|uniref:4032_t:CDS:1 n=1 Tax=Funneliformis geosporum TaxID=1117311 RepID=A0A9W4WL99_9GLOM|nr:17444_t:CDS:2 [Funneliformis geosporum]CAI2169980.1 4032_t:CDS:2 [Funneliformis geosporum]
MSGIDQNKNNNSTPPTQNSENIPPASSLSQESQNEKEKIVENTTTDFPTNSDETSNDKPKLRLSTSLHDFVVQIAANNSNGDDEDSVWGDHTTTYNLTRKLSNAEEDVCYPLRIAKSDGFDYESLEEYITEGKLLIQKDEENQHLSPVDCEPRKLSLRRISEFGERIKNANEIKEEYRFVFYSVASGTIKARSLAEIPPEGKTMTELLKQGIFWLDVLAPTDSEMRILSSIFHIHPLTMEDIETEESREKCEVFKNYYFVSFKSHDNNLNTAEVEPVNMYNVVMREGILSVNWINYAIMDDITDYFAPLIHKVEFESDAIDQLVMVLKNSEQQDMLVRIGLCRKMVTMLSKMLGTKVDVIKGLIKRCEDKLLVNDSDKNGPGDVSLYLGDIQDHIITMLQNLSHFETMLSRAHSNYLAQISIEITQLSNKTNEVLNRMTVFGTILLPMNVITGLFGMNVHVPGQEVDSVVWFFSIFSVLIAIGVLGIVLMKRVGLM